MLGGVTEASAQLFDIIRSCSKFFTICSHCLGNGHWDSEEYEDCSLWQKKRLWTMPFEVLEWYQDIGN